jgi:prophage tail gpP-like protein
MVYSDGSEELVPIGVFFIDHADVIVERNMSVVTLSGTDKWKKIAKSEFTQPQSWAAGSLLNDVIIELAVDSGITDINLDPLTSRTTDEKELNKRLVVDRGEKRADTLLALGTSYGLDIYFDADGILVSQDMINPADREVVFVYTAD